MGRDIAVQLIICIEYLLLAAGMYIYVSGVDWCIRRVKELSGKKQRIGLAANLIVIAIAAIAGIPALLVMAVLYIITMIHFRRTKAWSYEKILHGLGNLICLTVFMLLLQMLLHKSWSDYLEGNFFEVQRSTQVIVLVWLLMFQVILVMLREAKSARKEVWRYLHYAVGLKKLAEGLWFYRLMPVPAIGSGQIILIASFIFAIFLDYFILREIEILRSLNREGVRRISTPVNREEYYTRMEEEHLQIRRMFHDMKNQLMILENAQNDQSGYMKDFVQKSLKQVDSLGNFYHTGNAELNMLLSECKNRAESYGIEFDVVFQEGCLDFMEQEDIISIFVNAIINAIEACQKIKDGERKIQIQVGARLNDVIVSFKNTFQREDKVDRLSTTKEDKDHHGFGIPSIQRSADKYKGYVSISEDQQYFQLVILFVKE